VASSGTFRSNKSPRAPSNGCVVAFATTAVRHWARSGSRDRRLALARDVGPFQHVRIDQRRIRADSFDPSPAGTRGPNGAALRASAAPRGRVAVGACPRLCRHTTARTARSVTLRWWWRSHHRPQGQRSPDHLRAMPVAVADLRALGRDDRIVGSRGLCCASRLALPRVQGTPHGAPSAVQDGLLGWVPEWHALQCFDPRRSPEWRCSPRSPPPRAALAWAIAAAVGAAARRRRTGRPPALRRRRPVHLRADGSRSAQRRVLPYLCRDAAHEAKAICSVTFTAPHKPPRRIRVTFGAWLKAHP
jgi:hypothetical protein